MSVQAAADAAPSHEIDLVVPYVYRYHSEGFDDHGWGCVYRNIQTILKAMGKSVPALDELTRAVGSGDEWTRNPGSPCGWIEPHDVAEYMRRFVDRCPPMKLVNVVTQECTPPKEMRTCKVGTTHMYELAPRGAGHVRALVGAHLARTRIPVLIDDSQNSYLVAGFRPLGPLGGAQYRVLDPHYGLRYAARAPGQKFDPLKGADQYGLDDEKDQWVDAAWLEEGAGLLNGYTPGPTWMVLLIG